MKRIKFLIVALVLALIGSTASNVYWIREYYGKNPFLIKMEVTCKKQR